MNNNLRDGELRTEKAIAFLQSKTQAIDSYCRELQGYVTLFKELKIDVPDGSLKDLELKMLSVTTSCDALDRNMQSVVEAFQTVLAPKRSSEP